MISKLKWHRACLNKVIRDERLLPNRKLLATLVNMYLDSTGDDKNMLRTLILGEFVNKSGLKLFDNQDDASVSSAEQKTVNEVIAAEKLKTALSGIFGEENAS